MIEIRRDDFSVDAAVEKMQSPRVGAILTYTGTVREFLQGEGLEFEEDKSAAQRLEDIRKRAMDKFDVEDIAIIHRIGFLGISENILLVAVSAPYRGAAFDACQFVIDEIKDLHKSWAREVKK
jgi:Molybdopterin converting factor, large subunit